MPYRCSVGRQMREIEKEMKNLADKNWEWIIKRVAKDEYVATSPNKIILDTGSR